MLNEYHISKVRITYCNSYIFSYQGERVAGENQGHNAKNDGNGVRGIDEPG